MEKVFVKVDKPFDGFEIHPCKEYKAPSGARFIEQIDEGEQADMWSVYVHLKEGGLSCIADLDTEQQALDFVEMIETLLNNHEK